MSANIRIESGIAAGTSYWIDRPVLRIGSDPQCEICIPTADLSPHTLTVEFRGGVYRTYNRGSAPVYVGAASLQPGAVANWNEGEPITLPGDLRLMLAFDGDPRPSPRPDTRADDDFADKVAVASDTAEATPEAAKKAKTKSLLQTLIILGCIAATGGFLAMNQIGGSEAPPANVPTFTSIVSSSLDKDQAIRNYVQQLQVAQSFIVRGNPARAKPLFAELRERLLRQMDKLPAADRPEAKKILDYVERQLSRLSS